MFLIKEKRKKKEDMGILMYINSCSRRPCSFSYTNTGCGGTVLHMLLWSAFWVRAVLCPRYFSFSMEVLQPFVLLF